MLPIQDINAVADLLVIISCIVLVYVWGKKKCYHFSATFVPIIALFVAGFFLSKFRVTGEIDLVMRTVMNIVLVTSLALMCSQIKKECKKLFIVFSLYIIFLASFFFLTDLATALLFMRVIGTIIIMPFFIILIAYKHIEIKIVSLFFISGFVFLTSLTIYSIIYPSMADKLPFFINKIIYTAAFLLLAHFSVHKPGCILDEKIIKSHKKVRRDSKKKMRI